MVKNFKTPPAIGNFDDIKAEMLQMIPTKARTVNVFHYTMEIRKTGYSHGENFQNSSRYRQFQ
jgi:hypothetical protein